MMPFVAYLWNDSHIVMQLVASAFS